jgi:hypothetical protein
MLNRALGITGKVKRISGALRSGDPAAYFGMALYAIAPVSSLFDKLISILFKREKFELSTCPVSLMVVGPPRSGSTVIYQTLTRAIPSVYISNLHTLFPLSASPYMLKANLFGRNLGPFRNFYGHTSSLYDVNEGNEFITSLFDGSPDRDEIRKNFLSLLKILQATQNHPLIIKNLKAYLYLYDFHRAVPEIIFLRVRRNLEQIIQSVVRAHQELGSFNPIPEALLNSKINDPVEFAVRQIMEIERVIDTQKEQIDSRLWVEFSYEEFCQDPRPFIESLALNQLGIELTQLRWDAVPELRESQRLKVSQEEARKIKNFLKKYSKNDLYRNQL